MSVEKRYREYWVEDVNRKRKVRVSIIVEIAVAVVEGQGADRRERGYNEKEGGRKLTWA